MLHMGFSSHAVIDLLYDFTVLYKKIDSTQWHTGEKWLLSFPKAPV